MRYIEEKKSKVSRKSGSGNEWVFIYSNVGECGDTTISEPRIVSLIKS